MKQYLRAQFVPAFAMALLAVCSILPAQSSQIGIPSHNFTFIGGTWGFGFTSSVATNIVGLDLPTDAFQAGDTASYVVRINGTQVLHSVGNSGAISTNIAISPGDLVDVVGAWSGAVPSVISAHNSMGSPFAPAPYATTIDGVPHTLYRIGVLNDIGNPNWVPGTQWLTPSTGSFGRVLCYTSTTPASTTPYGTGCEAEAASFYELFATGACDLSSTTMLYLINSGATTNLTPTSWFPPATWCAGGLGSGPPAVVPLGDDDWAEVGNIGLKVGANGFVGLPGSSGYSITSTPSAAMMLNNAGQAVYFFHDMDPTAPGSGQVTYCENALGMAMISWEGVYSYGTTDPNWIQVVYNPNAGNLVVTHHVLSSQGTGWLIGTSAAGPSPIDPGPVDISAMGSISHLPAHIWPLSLASNKPVIGANWDLTTTSIDLVSPISITFFALTNASLPLQLVFPSAPADCSIWVDSILSSMSAPNVGGTSVLSVPVVNNQALAGTTLRAQSICLTLRNPSNLLTSNGILDVLGN